MSPDSDVIGTNYDGTRQERNGNRSEQAFRPGIALIASWPAMVAGLACWFPRASGPRPRPPSGSSSTVSPVWRSRVSTPSPISSMPDPRSAWRSSRPRSPARSGASATREIARPLWPIPISTGPSSAATTRSIWRAASHRPVIPRFWLISGQRLYLFGREENRDAFAADPPRYLRRCQTALAGPGTKAGPNSPFGYRQPAAGGSPQAMNSGTIKPSLRSAETQVWRLANP